MATRMLCVRLRSSEGGTHIRPILPSTTTSRTTLKNDGRSSLLLTSPTRGDGGTVRTAGSHPWGEMQRCGFRTVAKLTSGSRSVLIGSKTRSNGFELRLAASSPRRAFGGSASTAAVAGATKGANSQLHAVGKDGMSSSSSRKGREIIYAALGGFLITVAGGMAYLRNEVGGFDGFARSLAFYSVAIPRYLEYRLLMIRGIDHDEPWDELHERASTEGLDITMELRGFYIKTGQMAASNIGNAFPPIWQNKFNILQDQCPYKDFDTVRSIVEDDMGEHGKKLEDVFSYFEKEPIGAASIGQVHRATLKDTGEHVVVKIMYPEVESIFRGDVRTLKMFCQVAQPVHVPALEQVEKHFMTEFDYRKEARQQQEIRDNLIRAGLASKDVDGDYSKLCAVPKVYLDLCTKRVIVMEEFKGEKLADGLRRDLERHAALSGITPEQLREEEDIKDREARAMGILRMGPTAEEFDRYIALLNAKRNAVNASSRLYNTCVAWWYPRATWRPIQDRKTLPLNHAKLMDDLIYIFGRQVLVDGYFNGDPHPGNVLLLGVEEGHPQLGLIDYGQVGKLSKSARILFCKMIIALADDNRMEIIRLMKEAGFKSKNMKEEVIYKYGKVYYDEDNPELTGGKHIQLFVEDLESIDPILQIPDEFIMIGRASIMLRGLAHALHQSRSIAKAWREIAEDVLRQEGIAE